MTIGIDDTVEERFRHAVRRSIGSNKGALGKAVGEAMEKWAREKEVEETRKAALKRLADGYPMGRLLFKNRDELHER